MHAAVIESDEQEVVQPLPGTASPSPQQQQQQQQQQVHQQQGNFNKKMLGMLRPASPTDSQQLQLQQAHAQATGPQKQTVSDVEGCREAAFQQGYSISGISHGGRQRHLH